MPSSDVQRAVQKQRASNAAQIKRDNVKKIIDEIMAGIPKALENMRENEFPIYKNRGFEESQERVNGNLRSVWKFKNSQPFQTVIRGTTKLNVEIQGEDREFGIVFREGTNGRVTDLILVGRTNQKDDFQVVGRDVLLGLEPDQVDAIRAVIGEMKKPPPKRPVWQLDDVVRP